MVELQNITYILKRNSILTTKILKQQLIDSKTIIVLQYNFVHLKIYLFAHKLIFFNAYKVKSNF